MRAAIFRNGDFVVDDIKDPAPSEGQVLVKSLCCGICGSDLHAAKHTREFVDRLPPVGQSLGHGSGTRRRVRA